MMVRRLDENGEPCYGHGTSDFASGSDAVVILCVLALRMNMGQWFLDSRLGPAWMQPDGTRAILGTMPAESAFARSEMIRVIAGIVGVQQVLSVSVDVDHSTRKAAAEAEIITIYGDQRTVTLENIP